MIKNISQTKRYQTSFKAPSPNWVRKNVSMPKLINLGAGSERGEQNVPEIYPTNPPTSKEQIFHAFR